MRKLILIIYLILLALALGSIARGGPGTFPQGDHVKQLKDKIEFKNSLTQIISNDSDDPTSVAKNAAAGSVYLRTTGIPYIKLDAGSSTNWARILTTDNADANDVAYDANDNIRDKIDEFSDHGLFPCGALAGSIGGSWGR